MLVPTMVSTCLVIYWKLVNMIDCTFLPACILIVTIYSYSSVTLFKRKGACGTTNELGTLLHLPAFELVHAYINHLRSQLSPSL